MSVTPASAPTVNRTVDLALHVDHAVTGKPTNLDDAWVSATSTYDLTAAAGSQLRVQLPEGVGMNAWARAVPSSVSFARDGADYVATLDAPLDRIAIQTSAFQRSPQFDADDHHVTVGDVLPRLSVDGVPIDAPVSSVAVHAPKGWETAAADGTVDALHVVPRADDVVGVRDGSHGAGMVAQFTGVADGHSTTGVARFAHEVTRRTTDAATSALYTGLQLLGVAP